MARLEFASSIDVKTTPERAFDYFADYRHVPQVLEGVSHWIPEEAADELNRLLLDHLSSA